MTANSIEDNAQVRMSSSSPRDSSSDIFEVSDFESLNSAILAARISAAVRICFGSAGRMEYASSSDRNKL